MNARGAFPSSRASGATDKSSPVTEISFARRAKASRVARYVINQVLGGQMGIHLVQAFEMETGIKVDAVPRGFLVDYLGVKTKPCATKTGAIMVWAHLVDTDTEAANRAKTSGAEFNRCVGRIQTPS